MVVGKLRTEATNTNAMRTINKWLTKISTIVKSGDFKFGHNYAQIRFYYSGKHYEFQSRKQKNFRLNMHAIARVMESKIRAHIMGIEEFEKSMAAYLAIEATPEAISQGREQVFERTADKPFENDPTREQAFKVLGLDKFSSDEEIVARYRRLAKTYHPDMAVSEEAKEEFQRKFSEINSAYQFLKGESE